MPVKLLVRKDRLGRLKPASADAEEAFAKLPRNEDLWVEMRRARNGLHHRKFFALLKFTVDNCEEDMGRLFPTVERLRWELAIRTGRFDAHETLKGTVVPMPHSISFGSMKQDEFDAFYDDCIKTICESILPGVSDQELRACIEEEVRMFG